ncbi:MAG: c-type cytochrome [Magnetococcales bacterium]|nr:c-type cytochrome [Magnetococcales bacterium]
MKTQLQHPRRLIDKLLAVSRTDGTFQSIPARHQEELRSICSLYNMVAQKYLDEATLANHFEIIFPFLIFVYKLGKRVNAVSEEDVIAYFQWQLKKGVARATISTEISCIIDFFLVLLQEGVIAHNPLIKLYRLLLTDGGLAVNLQIESLLYGVGQGKPPGVQQRAEKRVVPTGTTAKPPDSHADLSDDDHDPEPVAKRRSHSVSLFLAAAVVLLLTYVSFHFSDSLLWQTAKETHRTIQDSAVDKSDKNDKKTDKKIEVFFKSGMKDYYCREYLKTSCVSTNLLANPVPMVQENIYAGRKIFVDNCARCHGDNGRNDGPDAFALSFPSNTLGWAGDGLLERDAYLFWIVAEGGNAFGGHMPQFRAILNRDEIWQVILYLKTLR